MIGIFGNCSDIGEQRKLRSKRHWKVIRRPLALEMGWVIVKGSEPHVERRPVELVPSGSLSGLPRFCEPVKDQREMPSRHGNLDLGEAS